MVTCLVREILCALAHAALATGAQVDLRLEPADQVALAGQIITVDLVASADGPESMTAIDAILAWDPTRLSLMSASLGDFPAFVFGFLPDPDDINLDITDGEALYTVLSPPTTPGMVPPDLLVASFDFEVLTSACVGLTPAVGTFGKTRVIGTVPGFEITGTIGPEIVVEVPGAWATLPGAIAGTGGLVPTLAGEGILLPCDPVTLIITDALGGATAYLVLGLPALNLPLKGGILVPDLDFFIIFPMPPSGDVTLTGPFPDGIPPGTTIYFQAWFPDPGAIKNFSATNGLSGTTP